MRSESAASAAHPTPTTGRRDSSVPSAPSPGLVLFNSEEHSDIVFNVGVANESTWRFPAHSFIVAEASPVFESIVNSQRDQINSYSTRRSLTPNGQHLQPTMTGEKEDEMMKPEIFVHCQPEIFHLMMRSVNYFLLFSIVAVFECQTEL